MAAGMSSAVVIARVGAAAREAGISTNVPRRPPAAVASSFTLSKCLPPAQRLGLRTVESSAKAARMPSPSGARPRLRLRQLPPRRSGPLCGWQASGQMSPVVRLRRSPPPLLCPDACHPRSARLADSREPQPGPPGCLTRGGRGACVRSKGGGDGRRPAPGDIRTQAPLPPALDQPAFLLDDAKKKRGPDVPEAAPGEKMPWKGQGIRTRS